MGDLIVAGMCKQVQAQKKKTTPLESLDPHLVKDKKSPSPKKNNNKKKAMKRK